VAVKEGIYLNSQVLKFWKPIGTDGIQQRVTDVVSHIDHLLMEIPTKFSILFN
jgi:hypothetical protein